MESPTMTKPRSPDTLTLAPIMAHCPSCGELAVFTFIGEQRWPARVAQLMGTKETTTLWMCGHCSTTISNIEDQAE